MSRWMRCNYHQWRACRFFVELINCRTQLTSGLLIVELIHELVQLLIRVHRLCFDSMHNG